MAEHIIELKDVTKYYDDNLVLENVSLYVNKGEFITFLGPSGCGKTTTLRMIAGFDIPTRYAHERKDLIERDGYLRPAAQQAPRQHRLSALRPLPPSQRV